MSHYSRVYTGPGIRIPDSNPDSDPHTKGGLSPDRIRIACVYTDCNPDPDLEPDKWPRVNGAYDCNLCGPLDVMKYQFYAHTHTHTHTNSTGLVNKPTS